MRAFWLLTGASAVSTIGNTFLYIAIPWALLESTDSSLLAVLSVAAQTAPYLAAPFLGPLIDRYDRRVLFAAGELIQGAAVAVIPLLLAHDQVAAVFVSLFVLGLANVVSDVAGDYGLIPALVPRERLDKASSQFTSILLVARFVGPALAGFTIAAVGTTWALEIDAATFLLTALTVVFMPKAEPQAVTASLGTMLKEGIAYFRARPDLRRLTMAVALYNLGAGALEPTLLAVGGDQWNWDPTALGVAVSFGAVAAALGAWLSPRALRGGDRHRQITLWLAVAALGSAGLLVDVPLAVVAGFCVLCLGEGGVNAATMAYRQQQIPDELSGRVNAVIRTFITGAVPVSALLLGVTSRLTGSLQIFLPVTLTALLAVAVWAWGRGRDTTRPAPADEPAITTEARG
ncbi:MFS transporter [Streptomyces coeruleoprunus]|uniref:MFS transporter n=1 Tax=Streptomyces coeruleoprunus TaxID=285563 RepID=A0ABV9X9L7_9ACTN